jgi:hypothetical protein
MTDFVETAMRHRCRNPRCRSKLPNPVSNPREAFCTKGCHASFYRKRCLICEGEMERKTEHQLICGKRRCRNALQARQSLGRYAEPSGCVSPLENPIKPGLKSALKSDRPAAEHWTGVWPPLRVVAAGSPIAANHYHGAAVGAGEALAEATRAGKRGYRRADAVAAPAQIDGTPSDWGRGRPAGVNHQWSNTSRSLPMI